MKSKSILFLRMALGLFLIVWGLDKLVNTQHGIQVSDWLYFGLFSNALLMHAYGIVEIAVGALIVAGFARRFAYPVLLAITGVTLVAVWKSILDPWGWWLEGTEALFFPSIVIFAASLVLWAFQDEDRHALDARPGAGTGDRTG